MGKWDVNYIINRLLSVLEQNTGGKPNWKDEDPPVFILGAPRSGTTILYQLLSDEIDFSSFTNYHNKLYGNPGFAERIMQFRNRKPDISGQANYGYLNGKFALSESANFWPRFYQGKKEYVGAGQTDKDILETLSKSLYKFSRVAKYPLLIKNNRNVLRPLSILEAVKSAKFIIIQRDVRDNAFSLLKARQKKVKTIDKWWSIQPPSYEVDYENCDALDQVIFQVINTYRFLQDQLSKIPDDQYYILNLEDLILDPEKHLDKIKCFLGRNDKEDRGLIGIKENLVQPANDGDLYQEIIKRVDEVIGEEKKYVLAYD